MKTVSPPQLSKRSGKKGFTLVEIALVIAIISVAIVPMLGLISVGMGTMKDAADSAVRAQIVETVSSMLLATPFDKLDEFVDAASKGKGALLFDTSGRKSDTTTNAAFSVSLSMGTTSYPGAPSTVAQSAETVGIEIAQIRAGIQSPSTASNFTILVPKR